MLVTVFLGSAFVTCTVVFVCTDIVFINDRVVVVAIIVALSALSYGSNDGPSSEHDNERCDGIVLRLFSVAFTDSQVERLREQVTGRSYFFATRNVQNVLTSSIQNIFGHILFYEHSRNSIMNMLFAERRVGRA